MLSSVYFRHPSATPGSSCSDDRSRPWVLLDTVAYTDMDDDEIPHNATSAIASTSAGATVEVTFALADPPALSSWFVRCTARTKSPHRPFCGRVVRAQGSLLLLRLVADRSDDFFVYSAGSGNPPSLHLLPYPPALGPDSLTRFNGIAILPRRGNVDIGVRHYLVVIPVMQLAPHDDGCSYVLHIFSSMTERWSAKAATVDWNDEETDYSNIVSHRGGKVIVMDDGYHGVGGRLVVGWVDLWQGVLTCDVLDADPVMRLIQLPPPSPGNMADPWGMGYEMTNAQSCRDVTCSNGYFKFIEIEHRCNEIDHQNDGGDTIGSSNATQGQAVTDYGWTATIWERPISSTEWTVCCTVDTSEISASDSSCPHLLPGMRRDDESDKMNFNRVIAAGPTLGLHDDDLLHMMCKLKPEDSKAWVLAVDPESKRLEALALFSDERMRSFEPTYIPCSFSSYLGTKQEHV